MDAKLDTCHNCGATLDRCVIGEQCWCINCLIDAYCDLRDKEAFRQAFRAGAAWATGSHQDFKQTHPDFDAWWASREEEE
jgi:hypothetical protein